MNGHAQELLLAGFHPDLVNRWMFEGRLLCSGYYVGARRPDAAGIAKEETVDTTETMKAAEDRKARLEQDKTIYNLTGGRVVSVEALAAELFQVYREHAGEKTHDGRPIPSWDEIAGSAVRSHWEAVALAAARILSS